MTALECHLTPSGAREANFSIFRQCRSRPVMPAFGRHTIVHSGAVASGGRGQVLPFAPAALIKRLIRDIDKPDFAAIAVCV